MKENHLTRTIFFALLFITNPLFAQTKISISKNKPGSIPTVLSTGDGYIVEWDRSSTGTYLSMTKFKPDGSFAWAQESIYPFQTHDARCIGRHSFVGDNAHGAYVVQYCGGSNTLRTQRISTDGTRMWGEDGKVIHGPSLLYSEYPAIAQDLNGGVFIAWNAQFTEDGYGISLQKYSPEGDAWNAAPVIVANRDGNLLNPVLESGHGEMILAYTQQRFGLPIGQAIGTPIAQKIGADGEFKWGEGLRIGKPGPAMDTIYYPLKISVLNTGNAVFFAWIVQPFDEKFQIYKEPQVYVQKVDNLETGTLAWGGGDGIKISSDRGSVWEQQTMVTDGMGGAWVAWTERSGAAAKIYQTHIPATGMPEAPTLIGRAPADTTVKYLSAAPDLHGGFFLTFKTVELKENGIRNFYLQHINLKGAPQYEGLGIALTNDAVDPDNLIRAERSSIVASNIKDQVFATWAEPVNVQDHYTFGQLFDYDGHIVTPLSVDQETMGPETFELKQNFPNPFNPSTTIGYTLASPGAVTLKIYNILGQEVAALVEGEIQQAGKHEKTFHAEGLPSGVYMYKLQTNDGTQTGKMILQK